MWRVSSTFQVDMKSFEKFLIIIIFGISYIWLGDAYSHQKEKHIDKSVETNIEPHKIEQNTLPAPIPVPSPPEGDNHPQKVEKGAFSLIQVGRKHGYNAAVVFTGFIAVIWGVVSFREKTF